jgi:hypothetical protein
MRQYCPCAHRTAHGGVKGRRGKAREVLNLSTSGIMTRMVTAINVLELSLTSICALQGCLFHDNQINMCTFQSFLKNLCLLSFKTVCDNTSIQTWDALWRNNSKFENPGMLSVPTNVQIRTLMLLSFTYSSKRRIHLLY